MYFFKKNTITFSVVNSKLQLRTTAAYCIKSSSLSFVRWDLSNSLPWFSNNLCFLTRPWFDNYVRLCHTSSPLKPLVCISLETSEPKFEAEKYLPCNLHSLSDEIIRFPEQFYFKYVS